MSYISAWFTAAAAAFGATPALGDGTATAAITVDGRSALRRIDGFDFSEAFQRSNILHGSPGLSAANQNRVGAATLVPGSLALLQASYADRSSRARAVGVWGGIAGIAAASGPIIGGELTEAASWRLVFFVNVPIGIAATAITVRRVVAPARRRTHGFDLAGQAAGVAALAAVAAALIEAGPAGWLSPAVLAGFAVSAAGAVFVAAERRAADPMIPGGLFASPTFSGATIVGLLINLGFYGQLFVFSLYLQQVRGYSPVAAGGALLPEALAVPAASLLSGRVTARHGPRPTMLTGLILGGAGLLGLTIAGPRTSYGLLAMPLVAAGFGMAFTMPAATIAVVETAPAHRAGIASDVINASRQVGSMLNVAIIGSLAGGAAQFVTGLHIGLAVAGAVFLLGALCTWFLVERSGRAPVREAELVLSGRSMESWNMSGHWPRPGTRNASSAGASCLSGSGWRTPSRSSTWRRRPGFPIHKTSSA
ncbi:MAG: MFS transporter [Micromonosporaceae bacterium]